MRFGWAAFVEPFIFGGRWVNLAGIALTAALFALESALTKRARAVTA
jgi:hypothetical protein